MLIITTIPTKKYVFCGEDIKLSSPCSIDWGDGTITLVDNLKQAKHTFKKKEKQTIKVTNLSTKFLTFRNDELIESIQGTMPPLAEGSLHMFFFRCFNLKTVDEHLFVLNDHHKNISYMCAGTVNLKTIKFLNTFQKAEDISHFLQGSFSRGSINELKFGSTVIKADYAFADLIYLSSPRQDILDDMENLESANGIFCGCRCFTHCYPYFSNNLKLKHIRDAFKGCPISDIDDNWLYYLPISVETDKNDIFDKKIKLNGM